MKSYSHFLKLLFFASLTVSNTLFSQSLDEGLISLWKFDNIEGSIIPDSHGTNDGTVSGGIQLASESKLGYSVSLIGKNANYIQLPTGIFNNLSEFSISVWVKASALNGSQGIVSSWHSVGDRMVLLRTNNNSIQYYTYTPDGFVGGSFESISTNTWYHIVATYDGASMKLYLDGVQSGTTFNQTATLGEGNDHESYIGNYKTVNASILSWDGYIDQLGAWNRELSASEVSLLYNSGNGLAYEEWSPSENSTTECQNLYCDGENIGIGTDNTYGYRLAVAGKTITEEVKIAQVENWPDYVFESTHDLRTLEEVEEHINENGHLPEIPGEDEVMEKGINLGEMNAKLLKKIEELTLYMIQINKEVKQLKSENQELKEKVISLESE